MRSSIQLVHCLLRGILRNSFYLRAIRQLVRSIYISQEICKKMQSGLYSALVSHTFATSQVRGRASTRILTIAPELIFEVLESSQWKIGRLKSRAQEFPTSSGIWLNFDPIAQKLSSKNKTNASSQLDFEAPMAFSVKIATTQFSLRSYDVNRPARFFQDYPLQTKDIFI
ncbi:hypothetical protein ACU8KH_04866 [Lachancea thermotolerans]